MNKIHKLPPVLVSKIAAGEVIERPAAAVKELIENAIDAGATEIKVYLEEAGLRKILVVDNGVGMSPDDVKESWKPHTTSKIKDEYELHNIKSLGFRGEALSSLAAVSLLTIQSRPHDSSIGYLVTVKEGTLQHTSEVGMPAGTRVLVEGLFAHLPARKKFLKSNSTETRQSIDVVNRLALAYPQIRFTLSHGKKMRCDYPVTANGLDRVEQIVGCETSSFFIPVMKNESYISVHGFIAKPQLCATTQTKQYLFINSRNVTDKRLAAAVKEAYGTMLESTAYPVFVLFVTLPYEMVDVNVHPRKEQVHFLNTQFVFETVRTIVGNVLSENNLTFENTSWKRIGVGLSNSFAGKTLKRAVLEPYGFSEDDKLTFLQFHKLYLVVSSKTDLLLVDQHAAHERILFEKLKKEFLKQKEKSSSHKCFRPVVLKLTATQQMLLEEYKDLFERLGFAFYKETMTHVPQFFHDRDPMALILQWLDDLEISGGIQSIDRASEQMLAFLACRAAVKAGDALTHDQIKTILLDLQSAPNNATCPHGRPTKITLSLNQLHTLFKRK